MTPRCITAPFFHLRARGAAEWEPKGAIVVDASGRILFAGPHAHLPEDLSSIPAVELSGEILLPAFVDLHSHLPQLRCRGTRPPGNDKSLLPWLAAVVYPEEARFDDEAYARSVAQEYFGELAAHGIGTAAIFASSYPSAARIAFEEAERSGLRVVMGMTLMDREVPDALLQDCGTALRETERLIGEWHGKNGMLFYAVTPRFAAACSGEMLRGCARLAEKHGLFIQTHINENEREIELVRRLFPDSDSYMRIYDAAGLLTRRTLLAHNIHAGDDELALCEERRSAVVHCPDSNLFLESGRFPIEIYEDRSIPLGLGCDVGAGSTVSMFHTMRAAEKVQQRTLDPLHLLFLATLGGAEAVSMGYETGNFAAGKSFDAVALSIDGILPDRKMEELSPGLVASAIVREGNRSNVRRLFIRGREAIASGG